MPGNGKTNRLETPPQMFVSAQFFLKVLVDNGGHIGGLESLCTIPKCSYAAFHGLNVHVSGVWAAYQNCISRNYTDHFWLLAAHPHTVTGSLDPRVFPQVWQHCGWVLADVHHLLVEDSISVQMLCFHDLSVQ